MKKIYSSINFINKPGLPLNTLIVSICLIGLFTSCKKEAASPGFQSNNSSSIMSIVNYCGGENSNLSANFLFQSNITNNDPAIIGAAQFSGFFYDKYLGVISGGPLTIAGHNFTPDNYGNYIGDSTLYRRGFYGSQLDFSFTTPNPSKTITGSMYSPLPIYISNIKPITPLTIKNGSSFEIKWNADLNNTKGVMLLVEGDSTAVGQNGASYNASLSNSIFVPDNGGYTLPWAFFAKFPLYKQFRLWAVRGNFVIVKGGDLKYQIGGYSATAIWEVKVIPD